VCLCVVAEFALHEDPSPEYILEQIQKDTGKCIFNAVCYFSYNVVKIQLIKTVCI